MSDSEGPGQAQQNSSKFTIGFALNKIFELVKNAPGKDFAGFDPAASFISPEYRTLNDKERQQIFNAVERHRQTKTTENQQINGLNPLDWFSDEKNPHFVPYKCAMDYLRVFPHVVTEYRGTIHQFTGKYYLKNAEGTIYTAIENASAGIVKPRDIKDAVSSLTNVTRIVDPDKIDLPMERIMPLPKHTIPIDDGLLNLLTKTIMPHSADYYYTECLPRHYIPEAKPEVFISFLGSLFYGDPDADLKKTQILEIIAWTLMNNYDIQGAVILYGQGGEGKSIIHNVIGGLLVHVTSLTLSELESDKFKRAELYGSWANLVSESSSEIITSEWFKRLTDGTIITVDRKNGHPFQMASRAKLILDVNELPNKDNELRAFYRRVITIIDFPNMVESILTPMQISEYVQKMREPAELDRIFSFVIDNYYKPLISRMKFTAQLSLADAEKKWEERSNPARSYIKMKAEAGDIYNEVDTVREILRGNVDLEKRYITRESSGEEYLTMVKADVIADAVSWAVSKGFPAKTINSGTLGSTLTGIGFRNQTVSKKVSKGSVLKAWRDIFIRINEGKVTEEVTDRQKQPLPLPNPSEISEMQSGNGSSPLPLHARAHAHMRENIEGVRYRTQKTIDSTKESEVAGSFGDPPPDPLPSKPENAENSSNSNIPMLQSVDHESVRSWLKSILTKPRSTDDLLMVSKNPDLQLGFLNQVLTFNKEDFLRLANGKWIDRFGDMVLYGVIEKFHDIKGEWYAPGTTILLRPGAGNTQHFIEKGWIYGPIESTDDPDFLAIVSMEDR